MNRIKKSLSLPNKLYELSNIKKGNSFNDFDKLELDGKVKFLSYGNYLMKNKETTREQRCRAIKNHYSNYN